MSELFEKIVGIQNKILLEYIADYKFSDLDKKINFVNKYLKLNYQKVNMIYDKSLLMNSNKKINFILKKQ